MSASPSEPQTVARPRWLRGQWSLRAFLFVCTLTALGVGLWFRPFVIETRRADGSLRTRFSVRRDWGGQLIAHGKQEWFLADGQRLERTAYGERMTDDFVGLLSKNGNNFDAMVWLITETIQPESWRGSLSLITGSGQTVQPQAEVPPAIEPQKR